LGSSVLVLFDEDRGIIRHSQLGSGDDAHGLIVVMQYDVSRMRLDFRIFDPESRCVCAQPAELVRLYRLVVNALRLLRTDREMVEVLINADRLRIDDLEGASCAVVYQRAARELGRESCTQMGAILFLQAREGQHKRIGGRGHSDRNKVFVTKR